MRSGALYYILRKAKFPLSIQHYAESNYLLGETTGERGAMKEKSPRQDRLLMCLLAGSWEKSPRDKSRNQNGAIRFLEKPLGENVERSDVSPLLG